MSHFTKMKTKLKDIDAIADALHDLGFSRDQIEVHRDQPTSITGYGGMKRQGNVVVRRSNIGRSYSDIGFERKADGTFELHMDSDLRFSPSASRNELTKNFRGFDQNWMNALHQRYSYNVIRRQAEELGYSMTEEYEDGELVVRVNRGY